MWPLARASPPKGLTLLPPSAPVFENSSRIVIVMEYASRGDLYDHISERQRLSEREARHFFRQIVSAVQYCHQVRAPAGAEGAVPGPGGWLPQRGPATPGSHREEAKARGNSSLSGGSVGVSGFRSLGRGWKDLWFVVPVPVKMGSLPI